MHEIYIYNNKVGSLDLFITCQDKLKKESKKSDLSYITNFRRYRTFSLLDAQIIMI